MQQLLPHEERFVNEIYDQMHAANTLFLFPASLAMVKLLALNK